MIETKRTLAAERRATFSVQFTAEPAAVAWCGNFGRPHAVITPLLHAGNTHKIQWLSEVSTHEGLIT
jgi:hypothetical protein